MNVFSGARRLALVVAALGAALVVGVNVKDALELPRVYYEVPTFLAPARLVPKCTNYFQSAIASERRATADGREYELQLCFLPSKSSSGEMLIPYELSVEPGFVMMANSFSDPVLKYTAEYLRNFGTSEREQSAANEAYWNQILEGVKGSVAGVGAWLAGWWVFVAVLGWIARGFAGIPHGADRRAP